MSFYLPVLRALNHSRLRYVVVGGLATVLHGYARFTADIDLILDLAAGESKNAIDAFVDMGFVPRAPVDPHDFLDEARRSEWIAKKNMKVFSFWKPGDAFSSIDLFVENPIEFEDLWSRAERVDIGGEIIRIASIPDLIDLKKLANRPQDWEDIKNLEEILRSRG